MAVAGQTPTRIHLIDSDSVTWEQIGATYVDPNDPTKLVRDVKAHAINAVVPVSTSAALVATGVILLVEATGGSGGITSTLPAAATAVDRVFIYKKVDAGVGSCTLAADGSEKIDGNANVALASQYDWVAVISNGTGWDIFSRYPAINFADSETPSGSITGTTGSDGNATFTLAHAPNPTASLKLFKNGQRLTAGTGYTLSTLTITYQATYIPISGDDHRADYRY